MNYNKIINNNDVNKENKKKVKWCEQNLIMGHHLHPEIDYFDQYNNGLDGLPLSNKNINSNVTKYLDKMKNSYSSTVCDTYPKKASIPVAPLALGCKPKRLDLPDCINEIDAHAIINTHVTNDRVLDYKQSLDNKCQENNMYDGEDIGNVYDNLVDNFRIKWGKIDSLNGNEKHDHYILENKPSEMGYTSFATY